LSQVRYDLQRGPERHSINHADEKKKRRELDLQIQHLELVNYELKLEALELERKLFVPWSEYTRDFPLTNTEVANNAHLWKSQVALVINGIGSQNIAL
jgi:hypothetical protein